VIEDRRGNLPAVEPLLRQAVAIWEKVLGPEHPNVARSLGNLGTTLNEERKWSEAEPLFRRAVAIEEKALGPQHPALGLPLQGLAQIAVAKGKTSEAEALYRRILELYQLAGWPPEHNEVRSARAGYAALLRSEGREREAAGYAAPPS